MRTTVTIQYGGLEFEIEDPENGDYQENVMDVVDFIENNQERFEEVGIGAGKPNIAPEKIEAPALESPEQNEDSDEEYSSESIFEEVSSQLRVPASELENFLYVDSEGEEPPTIYTEEIGELGEKQADRQRVASLILLYLWHECYGEDRIKSSVLKDALALSDISSSGMANMYQGEGDRYFDRRGRGPTATVKLTAPGKREAKKQIKKFVRSG